jgi:hypothetical protein
VEEFGTVADCQLGRERQAWELFFPEASQPGPELHSEPPSEPPQASVCSGIVAEMVASFQPEGNEGKYVSMYYCAKF